MNDLTEYDYIITLHTNMNNLFSNKTYTQNANVDLLLNNNVFNNAMSTVRIHSNSNAEMSGTISDTTTLELRYMEMIALKLFGNANARAAIRNDTALVSNVNQGNSLSQYLLNQTNDYITNNKSVIYNSYISSHNDVFNENNVATFNFLNQTISFPGWLNGSITNPNDVENSILNRNTNITGGISGVSFGTYNIKLLIRIGDQDANGVNA
jgi:hypothetical protein